MFKLNQLVLFFTLITCLGCTPAGWYNPPANNSPAQKIERTVRIGLLPIDLTIRDLTTDSLQVSHLLVVAQDHFNSSGACDVNVTQTTAESLSEMLKTELNQKGFKSEVVKYKDTSYSFFLETALLEFDCLNTFKHNRWALPMMIYSYHNAKSEIKVKFVSNLIRATDGKIVASFITSGYSNPKLSTHNIFLGWFNFKTQRMHPLKEHYRYGLAALANEVNLYFNPTK